MILEFCEWKDGGDAAKAADLAASQIAQETGTPLGKDTYSPSERDHIALLRDEDGIAALIVWTEWDDNAFIGVAWTRPDVRRRGHYRHLLQALRELASSKGLTGMSAAIHWSNPASLLIHDRLMKRAAVYYEDALR